MMSDRGISVEAWLAEMARIRSRDDEGFTLTELADKTGLGPKSLLIRLRKAVDLGRVTVGRRQTLTIIGRTSHTPVYKFVTKRGKK
jgi:hypothetical protein